MSPSNSKSSFLTFSACRDWHQLLEICALFDTLIADVDRIFDPAHFNDRLLLGRKGTMSEAELHILKARMVEGRRARQVPMGNLRRPSGEVVLDSRHAKHREM